MPDSFDDTYTESQVIMTTVKIIAPFTLTYGLFMVLHGADTPGGSFQGGAIVGVTVLMLAFAFGIDPTREWLRNSFLVGLVTGGVAIFAGIGLATIVLGGNFLEYGQFDPFFNGKWAMEGIEIGGIALIVSGTVITLFFAMAGGFTPERRSGGETAGSPASTRAGASDTGDREVSDDD